MYDVYILAPIQLYDKFGIYLKNMINKSTPKMVKHLLLEQLHRPASPSQELQQQQ